MSPDATDEPRPPVSREILLVVLALSLCPLAALLAPSDPAVALSRAHEIVAVERELGLYPEPAMYAFLQGRPALFELAGALYVWVHVPATVGLLVWLWIDRPEAYAHARRWLLATQAVVVAGYLTLPTAPPRLIEGEGFRDTLTQLYGTDAAALAHTVQSPYAAMPSGHVAFAVVVAGGLAAAAPLLRLRVLAWSYPLVVCVVVMATANHFWLDAAAGALAAGVGYRLASARGPAQRVAARRALRPGLAPGGGGHADRAVARPNTRGRAFRI